MKKALITIMSLALLISLLVGCGGNYKAKEGEPANGFLWKDNYSEITITGYVGSSNNIVIPDKINGKPVTLVASGAMANFSGLKSVKIPSSVKQIDGAFKNCKALEKIELADGVESINGAFEGCVALEKVTIPKTVKTAVSAFSGCAKLSEVEIKDGVENISSAFKSSAIEEIELPKSIKTADSAFANCEGLKTVKFAEEITGTILQNTFENCKKLEEVVIPEGITELNYTFKGCEALVKAVLPQSLNAMSGTFSGCAALKTLTIPENVDIDSSLVRGCSSLEVLGLPQSYKGSVSFDGLKNIKKITMSEESLDESLSRYVYFQEEVCKDRQDEWYKKMMNTDLSSYTYYTSGTVIHGIRYNEIEKDAKGNKVDTYEESFWEGNIWIKNYYYLAISGDYFSKKEKAVICESEKYEYYVEIEESTKSEIEINGQSFPVKQYY